jgi:hypothetical protein
MGIRKPDLSGVNCEAWKLSLVPHADRKEPHATISHWLLRGPWHMWWEYFVITLVHLRPTEGMGPPFLESPGMTHEIFIMALDPGTKDEKREYDPDNMPYPIPWLRPMDCVVQFACTSDARAVDTCEAVVRTIIAGNASPDSDWASYWERVIPATAACDKHPEKETQ